MEHAQGSLFAALREEGPLDVERDRAARAAAAPPPARPAPAPPAPPPPASGVGRDVARAVLAALDRVPTQEPQPQSPRRSVTPEAPAPAAAPPTAGATLEADLQRLFGFATFRPGQREVIEAVLAGRDALAVMPTGAGKSLTYSLPAFLLPGVTLVVSPLIALMQDQVSKLQALGLPAALVNSQVSWEEQKRALEGFEAGTVKLLFVAPERFRSGRFVRALQRAQVSLFAVDEAHCVSQWGHDFRPDYLRLGEAARGCGRPPVLAVTATATRDVQADIRAQLDLEDDALTLVRGFDRENLFLASTLVMGGASEKLRRLERCLQALGEARGDPKKRPGAGIVYCATRRNCDRVGKALKSAGLGKVGVYHAGLRGDVRQRTLERFFAGKLDVVVATNAFGLGVDKQDLRFVLHHDLPGSVEAYYQEAGRAGRDGDPATCALLFAPQDIHLQKFFITTSHPGRREVEQVAAAAERVGWDARKIERRLAGAVKGRAVESALRLLEQAEGDAAQVDHERVAARAAHEERLLDRMIGYARGRGCLRQTILDYFGADEVRGSCGGCDRCRPTASPAGAPVSEGPSPATSRSRPTRGRATGSRATAKASVAAVGDAAADAELLGRLRDLRSRLAKRKRVPPYKVFHDKTLLALAAKRPKTRAALLDIHGLGERKVSQYGKQLLELIAGAAT